MACFDGRRPKVMSQRDKMLEEFEPWPEIPTQIVKHWQQPRIILLTPESDNFKMYATTKERMGDALEEIHVENPFVKKENIWDVSVANMALFRKGEEFSLPEPVWSEDFVGRMPGQKASEKKQVVERPRSRAIK